ncbi:MAG TPA: glycosyltransferase family 4 protein [Hyphomicrobiaceae bacterium]|nr:glycosyltransferase family 4 protein [Hyphomicrobiaceae bacterium]
MLIVNFTLDRQSPVLAWQAAVANALAERVEAVHVFTEWLGEFEPAAGVTFDVMPHRPWGVPRRLGAAWLMRPRLKRILDSIRPDVCFVHMAHEWCYRLGPLLRSRHIPLLLWYAHGSVPWKLKLSSHFADRIITSTPEGFRIETPKKRVIGQAIDTDLFRIAADRVLEPLIVTVGRISRRKRVDLLIEAMAHLRTRPGCGDVRLIAAGPTLTADDRAYMHELEARVTALGLDKAVSLPGPMSQAETARYYESARLHVNVSETGSMDKTVMEALACGCPVLTSNVAFRDELAHFPEMLIASPTAATLAERMADWMSGRSAASPESLRAIVAGRHDLDGWADRLLAELVDLAEGARRARGTP